MQKYGNIVQTQQSRHGLVVGGDVVVQPNAHALLEFKLLLCSTQTTSSGEAFRKEKLFESKHAEIHLGRCELRLRLQVEQS